MCVLCGGHKPLPTRRLLLWPLRWAPLQGNHLHSPQTGRYARAALRGSPGQSERGHTKLKVENPAVCSPDAGMRADPLLCSASLALRFSRALEAPERLGAWMDLDLPLLAQPVGWPWEALREHVLGHYPNVCLGETPVMSDPPEANTHPQLLFQVGAPGHTGSRVPARSTSVCGEGGRGQASHQNSPLGVPTSQLCRHGACGVVLSIAVTALVPDTSPRSPRPTRNHISNHI